MFPRGSEKGKLMPPDENYAYGIINKLSFPRLVGTKGNKQAIDIISKEFKDAGYEKIIREPFETDFFSWTMARYIFFPIGIFLILIALSFFTPPFFTLIIFSVVILLSVKYRNILKKSEPFYISCV